MTRVGLAVHRTFHSLHTRNFRLYFIGQVVSVTGTWLNATASAWSGRSAACLPIATTSGRS